MMVTRDQTLFNPKPRALAACRLVHHANHARTGPDGVKVGGHMASSASTVTILTYLFFEISPPGRTDCRQTARLAGLSRAAILLGNLDRGMLRNCGRSGLAVVSSRTKDPDGVHFSTGSMGLGPSAANFAAMTEDMRGCTLARKAAATAVISVSWATPGWMKAQCGKPSRTSPNGFEECALGGGHQPPSLDA